MRGTSRLILLAVAAAFAGCESDPPPPAPAPPPVAAAPKPAAPAPVATEEEAEKAPVYEYAYSPVGKRDPFRSLFDDAARLAEESSAARDCGPLSKWELEQLKLVAVISGLSNPLGMVEDPQGRGHVVRRGTCIGKHNGKVTQIRSGEVVVSEVYKDHLGKPHINARVMTLPVEKQAQAEDTNLMLATETAE